MPSLLGEDIERSFIVRYRNHQNSKYNMVKCRFNQIELSITQHGKLETMSVVVYVTIWSSTPLTYIFSFATSLCVVCVFSVCVADVICLPAELPSSQPEITV